MPRARVVLVDDYEPAHEMYQSLLEPEVEVVAAVCDAKEAQSAAKAQAPDLMILDIEMGTPNGFFVARWLKQHTPEIRIVFLTMHAERAYVDEAIKIGANGYVVKRNASADLLLAVRAVLTGGTYFPK